MHDDPIAESSEPRPSAGVSGLPIPAVSSATATELATSAEPSEPRPLGSVSGPPIPAIFRASAIKPAEKTPFWGYGDLALLIGCFLASFVVTMLLLGGVLAVYPKLKGDVTLAIGFQLGLYAMVYLSLHFTLSSRYGQPTLKSLGWQMPTMRFLSQFDDVPALRSMIALAIPAFCGFLLPFAINLLVLPFHPPKIPSPFEKFTITPGLMALFALVAAVLAPAIEELIFRGFLQPLLSRTFGVVAGILLTAAVFGALHAPEYSYAWQFAAAVGLAGVAFGVMRAWTNSTLASTVMHSCFNLVMVMVMYATHGKH